MAASKKTTTRRQTGGSKSKNSRNNKSSKSQSSSFREEILLLIILAAAIILLISDFGLGGFLGDGISTFMFGAFGWLSYVFPILLFVGAAFLISNSNNLLAYKKMIAAVFLFVIVCGLVQLLTEGYMRSSTISDYFQRSANYHTGGGVTGGVLCMLLSSAFGVIGAYVLMTLGGIVCLIILTQRSFFGFFRMLFQTIAGSFQKGMENRKDQAPMRQQRAEEKRLLKEERKEEKRRKQIAKLELLEAEAEQERLDLEERKQRRNRRNQEAETSQHFLEGTKLTLPELEEVDVEPEISKTVPFEIHRSEPASVPLEMTEEEEVLVPESVEMPRAQEPEEEKDPEMPKQAAPVKEEKKPSSGKNPRSSKEEIQDGISHIQKEIDSREPEPVKEYEFPPLTLLKKGGRGKGDSDEYLRQTAKKLQETLHNFGVNVTVTNVSCGPTVTRYELQPEQGVKVSRIVNLSDDIKLNLATPDIRIEAPIPGKAAVGIEVPNKTNSAVMLRDLLSSEAFQKSSSKLAFAVGKDIAGQTVVTDIAKMPHLLIAGATGSGKSVCINTLIMSILYKAAPEEVKLIMIDPKVVELSVYNGIPHLFIPVVTDPKKAAGALNWAVSEMTNRYNIFAEYNVRNLADYNRKIEKMTIPEGEEPPKKLPQIVIIVDELADLMMVAPGEVEDAICRLAQLARAAGIHLIIATQRPSVNVITGLIKANMPSRIAFSVSSGVDSRTILDMNGAEKLLGKGDMLFYPQGYQKPARLQGAFVSDEEVSAVVEFLSNQNLSSGYDSSVEQQVNTSVLSGGHGGSDERDTYFVEAGKFIIEKEKASIGMLQRMFKIGFNRAARIMDQLAEAGVVGPEEGTKPRKVLMTMEEFEAYVDEYV